MARPQKFRHSRETLNDPQIAAKLGGFVLDIETLRMKRKQIDDQIAAAYDAVDDGGFEKKFVRKIIALRAKEEGVRRDEEQGLEAYEIAIEKGVSLACARRERNLPPHDPITGELTDTQEQPETARNEPEAAAEVAGDYLREPVAAEQGQIIREGDAPRETGHQEDDDDRRAGGVASSPDTEFPSASPRADAVAVAPRPQAATAPIPEGIPAFLLKERKPLRPNCLNHDNCAGYGSKHCHSCLKARGEAIMSEAVG